MEMKMLKIVFVCALSALAPLTHAHAIEPYEYAQPSSLASKALLLDVAEIENWILLKISIIYFTKVVLPAPEGAEKTISLLVIL